MELLGSEKYKDYMTHKTLKVKNIKNWLVYDFEVDGKTIIYWALKTNQGTFKYGRRGKSEFLKCLKELCQKKTWYAFAHCGVKYDCSFLIGKLANECKVNRNEHRTTNIKWNNINFLDSYLLFRTKLEKLPLTKEEAIIKKEGRLKIEKPGGIRNMSKEEVKIYCDNDVNALFRLLNEFFQEHGEQIIGKISISSICFYLWKKQNPEEFKWFPNLAKPWYDNIYNFIQPYLSGGFCGMTNQAIYRGRSVKMDMNSIYPDIMVKMPLPVGLPIKHLTNEECKGCWNKKNERYSRPHKPPKIISSRIPFGFIKVEINNLEAKEEIKKIPFVPVKYEEYDEFEGKKLKTAFCPLKIEKLEGVFFSEYLKFILKHYTYTRIRFKEAYVFRSAKGIVFKKWVEKYQETKTWAKKNLSKCSKDNKPYWNQQYYFAKLMLNCLFGKFGQKKERRELLWKEGRTTNETVSPTYRKNGKDYHLEYGEEKDGFGFNYAPIACAITSYARIHMIETMLEIGVDNVLYWDTDCIVSKVDFPRKLIHPWLMGKWKIEANYSLFVSFAAKAYYGKNLDGSPDWKFKGPGEEPFLEYKVDPIKLLLKGLKESDGVMGIVSEYNSWGTKIFKKPIIQRSAYQNRKMQFIKKEGEYFWLPYEQAGKVGTEIRNGKLVPFVELTKQSVIITLSD